jgi:hypothetical protein
MTPSLLPMSSPPVVAVQPPRLLDQVAQAARQRGASQPTTAQLVSCVRAFVLFHGKRQRPTSSSAASTCERFGSCSAMRVWTRP